MTDKELMEDLQATIEYYYPSYRTQTKLSYEQSQQRKKEVESSSSLLASFFTAIVLLPMAAVIYSMIFVFEKAKLIIQGSK